MLDDRRVWRPWGLAVPLLCLLVTLPLLRPLTHPARMSDDEQVLVETARSFVRGDGGALPPRLKLSPATSVVSRDGRLYASQPPMLALLVAGPSKVLDRTSWSYERSPERHLYLLTLLLIALPTAAAAGLVYRIGRMFELKRSWRATLAAATVFGTGWISYSTVLNPHALAAACVVGALAAVVHVAATTGRSATLWYLPAGLLLGLAATLDSFTLPAVLVTAVAPLVLWKPLAVRGLGMLLLMLGAAGPIAAHGAFAVDPSAMWSANAALHATADRPTTDESEPAGDSVWVTLGQRVDRLAIATIGQHGVLSHFPILLVGLAGLGTTLRRHWPPTQKLLAFGAGFAAVAGLIAVATWPVDWPRAMFACRWVTAGLPVVMIFAGAWLKRPHHPAAWTLAAMALAWSVTVSLVGATGPMPPGGFDRFTAWQAARQAFAPTPLAER